MSMKNTGFKTYFFIIFIISLIAIPFYDAYGAVGKIADLSGSVSIRDKNNVPYKTAKKGDVFDRGYWIKTGGNGWASLLLSDGSKITLANNTELEITEYLIGKKEKNGVFTVTQGKLRASVTRLAGERVDYKVKSATAVAGIKGTEFMMMTQGQANVFFGNEGSVGISGNTGDAKKLGADTMVQNTRGYVPVDPVEIKPETPLYTAKNNFKEITAAQPPKDWELSNNLPHIIARWNINYGHYLADAGKYDEALHVFQIALDLTDRPDIRSDARLERGAVYSSFLGNPEAALSEYLLVLEEYPQVVQREVALYNVGRTLYELGFKNQAKQRLLQYKKEYPSGRYLSNVETYLNTLGVR
ncbi:MAG TPA: FecR domain-containing protein [Syntrophorhabdaceae bacterium]|nr:FecR domain-containing protein [Syntrophorhabdaceae bacterium]HOT42356.1 FecR domain-containing protein [Syntrophorhabdaceae bacterium]HQE80651.1 FecR domain-containing protein [Syntrophorhabdaceae bacterium]HQH42728.1 FecR domain-containing protein [Syntrophorhabdaceae bacterium]HQK46967.1 FecR domain-containing protein [Syntrophorhabdaceae bacterium]